MVKQNGEKEKTIEIIKNMFKQGMNIEDISRIVKLNKNEVESILN